MKIFGIIFMALGVVGALYCIPNILIMLASDIPGVKQYMGLYILIGLGALCFIYVGNNLYKKVNKIEAFKSAIKNLKARNKNTGENFSIKITNAKVNTGMDESAVGLFINDEDKGKTAEGKETTYDLSEGSHKLQFYIIATNYSVTNYPAVVLDFGKESALVVNFKVGNNIWEITN